MNGWLESVQQVIATLKNFLHVVVQAVSDLGNTVPQCYHYISDAIGLLPVEIAGAAALCLVVALLFLVLNR